ncbi:ADP-ribosylglycohydrolase family protein [Kitasatospora sp. NBC_00240]|uniref:ADP-ribosylglycohydrolase family protein n=1 Tax=Kitasatospora sp. NBC_00240 TaxID=2903567 RepID=UPI00225A2644|nr:ADP-ribosylglycohydrolase family protein [Kitasatospora sp. NBC_00240]MCX5207861.1 ADP-ribosylglycohydrolase family protein [Kitasatospora sp. NBC_00240]
MLGGAIGDALGNPVEFLSLDAIRAKYGAAGVTGPVADAEGVIGRITDDTQMTLFTAEGYLLGHARSRAKSSGGAEPALVREAYLRWLDTQNHPAPPPADGAGHRYGWLREEPWLYARRAPGNACLSGLRSTHVPRRGEKLDGTPGPVNPDSKGCGTVMRSAPFGFAGLAPDQAFELAAACAQITHGHPTGYYAAGAFAALVGHLVEGDSLQAAVLRTLHLLSRYQGHQETTAALRAALDLAADGEATPEKVESLGAGWVAEEALSIAVYAALAPTRPQVYRLDHNGTHCDPRPPRTPVEAAFLLSVNHSGDSDSTGSLCGNLLGALHGDVRLPQAWLAQVEGRAVIAALADDFAAEVHPGERRPWTH